MKPEYEFKFKDLLLFLETSPDGEWGEMSQPVVTVVSGQWSPIAYCGLGCRPTPYIVSLFFHGW